MRGFGGGDGIARFRSPEDWLIATTLDVGADGRILVGGTSGAKDLTGEFVYRRFLVRFDATGIRDPSFGADGVLLSLTSSYGYTDVQQIGSKIVASGRSCEGCPEEGIVWRLLEDGSPDPTFSGDGEARLDRAMPFGLDKVGVDDRGRVTAVGWSRIPSRASRSLTVRFRHDGELDENFCGNGVAWRNLGTGWSSLHALDLRVAGDGSSIAVWTSNEALTVVHRRPSCILDARFSSDGVATPSLPTYPKSVQVDAARILARGRVVLAGYTEFGSRAFHPMVARLTVAGRLDRSFGRKGISVLPLADAWFTSVTADARGRPIAGGLAYDPEDGLLIRITRGALQRISFGGLNEASRVSVSSSPGWDNDCRYGKHGPPPPGSDASCYRSLGLHERHLSRTGLLLKVPRHKWRTTMPATVGSRTWSATHSR